MATQFRSNFDPWHNLAPREEGDPLLSSDKTTLPFNVNADSRLSTQRNVRYDALILAGDEAELRLREIASIMGIVTDDDDFPTAA